MNIEVKNECVELGSLAVGDLFEYGLAIYLLSDKKSDKRDDFLDNILFCPLGEARNNYDFLSEEASFHLGTEVVPVKIDDIEFYYKAHSIRPPYTKKIRNLPTWSLFEYNGYIYLLTYMSYDVVDEKETLYDCFVLSNSLGVPRIKCERVALKADVDVRLVQINSVSFVYKNSGRG